MKISCFAAAVSLASFAVSCGSSDGESTTAGQSPSCVEDETCPPSNVCHHGKQSCSGDRPVCVDTGSNEPDGTSCGPGLVCSAGTCVAVCTAGQSCRPPSPCMSGVTVCSSTWAAPVCTDSEPVPDGTSCGEGNVCSGGACIPPTCEPDATCQPANRCNTGVVVCTSPTQPGTCSVSGDRPDGSPCGERQVCSDGTCVAETIDHVLARCPTAAEIEWVGDRLPDGLQFEFDPTAGELVCRASEGSADLTRFQERAYQAVLIMRRLEFDAPLPWTADDLSSWFTSSITGVRFRSDIPGSFCCDPGRVINIKSGSFPPDTFLAYLRTLGWGDYSVQYSFGVPSVGFGLDDLVYLYAHEARHVQLPHNCAGGKDTNPEYMGAWGVQMNLQLWIADHSDPLFMAPGDPTLPRSFYRDSARHRAQTLGFRFCDP
jgi:hypothetical protein